jgi:short-subunit dehydrogenase
MAADGLSFGQQYGPWALVLGASDGVGAAFAREVAERGVNVVLVARRQAVLDEVAKSIRADCGVEAQAVAIDLAESDASDQVIRACAGLEIGLLMYNAGADPDSRPFLDTTIEFSRAMLQRNCVVPMELCHHFAPAMVDRGRGGIVLVSSAGGLYGMQNMVTYGATKAFDIVFAEALWTELHGKGVDVLALVLAATDTPAFRKHLAERGLAASDDDPIPFPGVTSAEETAADAIAKLADGPTWFVGDAHRAREADLRLRGRNDAVRDLLAAAAALPKLEPKT